MSCNEDVDLLPPTTTSPIMAIHLPPTLEPLHEVKKGLFIIKAPAVVGKLYTIHCPCCEHNFMIRPKVASSNVEHCPRCNAVFGYNAYEASRHKQGAGPSPQLAAQNTTEQQPAPTRALHIRESNKAMGKLEWHKMWLTRSRMLHIGSNTVGRRDEKCPSDIMFDDKYMSRQSVDIEVTPNLTGAGYTFKLTVLKAANPVMVGSTQLKVGNSIFLNYGDTIRLGNTILAFKPIS